MEGFHALKHALRFGAVVELALSDDAAGLRALAAELAPDLASRLEALVRIVSRTELRAVAPQIPHTHVLALARRPAFALDALLAGGAPTGLEGDCSVGGGGSAGAGGPAGARDAARPLVLLEDPRHLGNVGAVVRVAAGADAAGVLTTGARDPWDPAALRGAAGLHYALPVGRLDDAGLATLLSSRARPLIALDPDGDPLRAEALPPGAVLAFGTERHGLSDALLARADQRLRIPMRAGVSSLNLATAVAAVLFAQRLAG